MNKLIRTLAAGYACGAMVGCMTAHPLPAERAQLSQALHPDDRVEIVTTAGQRLKFKVETIDENGLRGAQQSVAYEEIQSVSVQKMSIGRTALAVAGIAAAAALAAGGGGSGSSGY